MQVVQGKGHQHAWRTMKHKSYLRNRAYVRKLGIWESLGQIGSCLDLSRRLQRGTEHEDVRSLGTSVWRLWWENDHRKVPTLWSPSLGSCIWGTDVSVEWIFYTLALTHFHYDCFKNYHVENNLWKCLRHWFLKLCLGRNGYSTSWPHSLKAPAQGGPASGLASLFLPQRSGSYL